MRIREKLLIIAISVFLASNFVFANNDRLKELRDNANSVIVGDYGLFHDRKKITFSNHDDIWMVYSYKSVPAKPYVKELSTPGGINVLRDAPHDHLHHHGLMFGLKVNKTDFWTEHKIFGKQNHKSFSNVNLVRYGENLKATVSSLIDWIDSSKKVLLQEKRELLMTESGNATVLTWQTVLKTPEGISQVKIGGSHYFGLGMRFVKSMDANGTFINATGKEGEELRDTHWLVSAKWCAYQSAVDGKPVTVAMFDHPKNFRPVTWFTMLKPFSYLSATLKYHEKPFVLKSKDELSLKYGVTVWDGKQSKEVIEKAYQKWVKPKKSIK